jgi:carbamoyltransferase
MRVGQVDPSEITDVVIAGLPFRTLIGRMFRGQLCDALDFHGIIDYVPHMCKALYRLFYLYRAARYNSVCSVLRKRYGIRPRLHFVEHHQCHASAVYRTAPFDDALIVTADGVGDDISITISTGQNGRIDRLAAIPYPHSFGQFYTACTQALGFRGGRHEGKITGLSGFGKVDPDLYQRIRATIRRSGKHFALDKRYYSEGIVRGFSISKMRSGESLFDALQYRNYKTPLKKLIANEPRENVAAVFQQILEDELEALVRPYAEQIGLKNLALCGGLFANVKANEDLFRRLNMEKVYIFPHMGDGGLSVGAALELLQTRPKPFDDVYWGPEFSEREMESALRAAEGKGLKFRREDEIERTVAERLAEGKVIARFNGRMEFGPRALGNRSILYRASDPTANKWLNDRLKRTEFMPFAPIVMAERTGELFLDGTGTEHACKFMTIILKCSDYTKEHCPAIVHVDGTARPQCVTEKINPSMYRILAHYESITGVPVLVNTSYNMHEEPIVCTPEDAVRAYMSSRLDNLAMGPFLAWLQS